MNYFLSFILIIQQCLSKELLIEKYVYVANEFFDRGQVEATNGDFNVDDPSNNRYSIIGTVGANKDNYRDEDGNFEFRLVWHNIDGTDDDVLIWKQSSWIGEDVIVGYEAISVPFQSGTGGESLFKGLGRSENWYASYIDGNGNEDYSWNTIIPFLGVGGSQDIPGILGFNEKLASGNELYIRNGTTYDCSHLDIDGYLIGCSTEFSITTNAVIAVADLRNEFDDYKESNDKVYDKIAELEVAIAILADPKSANSGLVTIDNNSTISAVLSTNNLLLLSLIINIFLAFIGFYMFLRLKKANNYGKIATFADSENQELNN